MDFISFIEPNLAWKILNWITFIAMWVTLGLALRSLIMYLAIRDRNDIFLSVHFMTVFGIMLVAQLLFKSGIFDHNFTQINNTNNLYDLLKKYDSLD